MDRRMKKMLPLVSCLQLQQMGGMKNVHVLYLRKTVLLCLVIAFEVGMTAASVFHVAVCAKWILFMLNGYHMFVVVHCTFTLSEKKEAELLLFQPTKLLF
jgi:hypothetical protein